VPDSSITTMTADMQKSKTIYYTATSLDGYIAGPDNSLEWLFQLGEAGDSYQEFIANVGALAMGSTTYEWVVNHMARGTTPEERAWPYQQPTWVFTSRTLTPVPGADIRFVRGDVRPVHAEMAAAVAGRDIWLVGGGELVGQFHDHGLLDEIIVQISAVTLGAGAPLLPRAIVTPPLRILSTRRLGESFVEIHYQVDRG
jgi:dihydrofolate reductase